MDVLFLALLLLLPHSPSSVSKHFVTVLLDGGVVKIGMEAISYFKCTYSTHKHTSTRKHKHTPCVRARYERQSVKRGEGPKNLWAPKPMKPFAVHAETVSCVHVWVQKKN